MQADAERYRVALLDWLACAVAGSREAPAIAARAAGDGLLERVTAAGCAGHVLDYDDTYSPGLVHASAPVAPAALWLGAELDHRVDAVLEAFAAGFEATASFARAGHPALYERGWHPTAVCGTAGAAVAAARLLGPSEAQTEHAVALALTRASGLRSAFGSAAKSMQVGMAAAAGVQCARLAGAGADVPLEPMLRGPAGFEAVFGAAWPTQEDTRAIRENWIKAYPCCLATHSAIEAALQLRGDQPPDSVIVTVHPLARAAAAHDDVTDGLTAKFSIPYLTAFALLRGAPRAGDFGAVDGDARALARHVEIRLDAGLEELEARVVAGASEARVASPLGSPRRPMDAAALRDKVQELAGERLEGVLDDPARPAADVLAAAVLS